MTSSPPQPRVLTLAVSDWFPYRHQATALQQLVAGSAFDVVALETVPNALYDESLGPFIVMLDGEGDLPVMGVPAIVEALDRMHPGCGILGSDALSRAQVRAFAAMIEERFSRYCVAAIPRHAKFGRDIWQPGLDIPERVLTTPPMFQTIEKQLTGSNSRYVVGNQPSVADCLLAALWWTAEDMDASAELLESPWIAAWHSRNCHGDPFDKMPIA